VSASLLPGTEDVRQAFGAFRHDQLVDRPVWRFRPCERATSYLCSTLRPVSGAANFRQPWMTDDLVQYRSKNFRIGAGEYRLFAPNVSIQATTLTLQRRFPPPW